MDIRHGRSPADAARTAAAWRKQAVTLYDGDYVARVLLGTNQTPKGRRITGHAAERMVMPPPWRLPMTLAEIDAVLDGATSVVKRGYHPQGDTLTIENANLPGKLRVVVDAATGQRVITALKKKRKSR